MFRTLFTLFLTIGLLNSQSSLGTRANSHPGQYASKGSRSRGCDDLTGKWKNITPIGSSTWELQPLGGGRYSAVESGWGNARGTATFTGTRLRIDWVTGGFAGYYEWNLDGSCEQGSGRLVFTRGRTDSHQSSVSKIPSSGGQQIRFNFSGYGNPQRPFPGYVGPFQLGPVYIAGSGEIRADGTLLSGGRITHTDNLRDRNYPNHSTTWQVIKGLGVQSAGGVTVLRLQVQVVSSNYTNICPVGTLGVIELIDDNRQLANGQTSDGIRTEMPTPASRAPSGGAACGTHTHGMNNTDVNWTNPPRGGPPSGGMWAIVEIGATKR